jgi:2-polyprenyl-6-methoxyphenol hydroxylase-like FAD-dependent oxidoreductase
VVVACDGIHSAVRRQLHPGEGDVVHAGITMWRGLSRHAPFLSGGSHVRVGSLRTGKLVVYPIRNLDDGTQLVNWVAEVAAHERVDADWSRPGELADFIDYYRDWHFDWLDVPKLLESAELILEYPMADRDPLDRWAHGRVALLGDAAHPMLPRGSNGAMQAVLDARTIADELAAGDDPAAALARYERRRLEPVNHVVLTNRSTPPDVLIETVHERTGDRPFAQLSDVIDEAELHALLERYKRLTGYDAETLAARAAATGGMA